VSDGGPERAAIEMCRELMRRGDRAEIYTSNIECERRPRRPLDTAPSRWLLSREGCGTQSQHDH